MRYVIDEPQPLAQIRIRDGDIQLIRKPASAPGMDEIVRNRIRNGGECAHQRRADSCAVRGYRPSNERTLEIISLPECDDLLS